ncbi:MAG TPA: ABC transporter ATP-binding protein [Thermoleophilaceae bacterium]|nr:ABC transporter ATP-binding protein [Thermoleophilaceae bacterium]
MGEALTLGFRARLFGHVQRLSLGFHDMRGTTDSIYRIQYDAPAIQWITISGLIPLVASAVALLTTIYVIARIDWALGLVAVGAAPFLILLSRAYDRRMRPRYLDFHGLESNALGVVQEVLTAFCVVKAFGAEQQEHERFVRTSADSMRARVRLAFAEGTYALFVHLTTGIGAAVVLLVGVLGVQSGRLSLGSLLVVIAYLAQLYEPMTSISSQASSLQLSLASAERSFDLLKEAPDVPERPNARRLDRSSGAIEFRDVSFSYDGRTPVLEDLSFVLAPGKSLGVAGPTGAGKTTLVSLLTRFYDPEAGQILLDGIDLRDYRVADLRNQFAIVLQEPVLFSSSIGENISYGRPAASYDEIVAAARAAHAHDFVVGLPDGYQTLVGERGMRLSGGERQRLALARAFLKDAPILILDEPTSSVDVGTESLIMEAMERLMVGRTAIMIAHRLSTLESCDARIEVEGGRIVSASGLEALV